MTSTVHYSSVRPDWETPAELFAALDVEFRFTLDVCATAANAKVSRFYSPAVDGLRQPWTGVCWMNPPYGRSIAAWVRRAYEAARAGVATVVCLLPARTDTDWWHRYVMEASEIRLIRGRVRFAGAAAGAPFPSTIVIFRPDVATAWRRSLVTADRCGRRIVGTAV